MGPGDLGIPAQRAFYGAAGGLRVLMKMDQTLAALSRHHLSNG
jgi:hypothetical protein